MSSPETATHRKQGTIRLTLEDLADLAKSLCNVSNFSMTNVTGFQPLVSKPNNLIAPISKTVAEETFSNAIKNIQSDVKKKSNYSFF
jgi:hypothetical protein